MASANKFNQFVQDLANKAHSLAADVFKVALSNSAPVATNTVFANISEISAGNGYTAGGTAATITSSLQTSGVLKWLLLAVTFTASGGTIGPFRYAALYNSTQTSPNKPLILWWDYGSAVTMNSGDTFTVGFDQTNGVLTIT